MIVAVARSAGAAELVVAIELVAVVEWFVVAELVAVEEWFVQAESVAIVVAVAHFAAE